MKADLAPFLDENEEVLFSKQGLFKENLRSGWRPGRFYLTNERVLLFQPSRIVFQTALKDIVDLTLEKRAVILRSKEVICLSYRRPPGNGILKVWMAVGEAEAFRRRIYEESLLRIDHGVIEKIVKELDPESQSLLVYLWQNRHASIDELADVCQDLTHSEILGKIRQVINPTAERLTGYGILSFKRSKIDEETGRRVTFRWWILGRRVSEEEVKKPLIDVFDERSHLTVIVELAGVREEDILLRLESKKLFISSETQGVKYDQEIPLPVEVDTRGYNKSYNNNVLELKFKKLNNQN